jgi:hypothetical protein
MFRIEHNVATGEITKIELTEKEIIELEKDWAKAKIDDDKKEKQGKLEQAQRQAIADRLNLTTDDLKALGL